MDSNLISIEKRLHQLEMKEADQGKLIHELGERLSLLERHDENVRRFGEIIEESIKKLEADGVGH